jgi:hypothetical protein
VRQTIEIGATPCEEDCVQFGSEGYEGAARAECRRFIDLIRACCGPEPEGARLFVKANRHDFGSYLEVACQFDDSLPEAVEYAFWVENGNGPRVWGEPMIHKANENGHPLCGAVREESRFSFKGKTTCFRCHVAEVTQVGAAESTQNQEA